MKSSALLLLLFVACDSIIGWDDDPAPRPRMATYEFTMSRYLESLGHETYRGYVVGQIWNTGPHPARIRPLLKLYWVRGDQPDAFPFTEAEGEMGILANTFFIYDGLGEVDAVLDPDETLHYFVKTEAFQFPVNATGLHYRFTFTQ